MYTRMYSVVILRILTAARAGYIQMCPQRNTPKTVPGDRDEDFHTALHEILHIIGWSSALFPFFRDSSGHARTTRCPSPPHRHTPTHRHHRHTPTHIPTHPYSP